MSYDETLSTLKQALENFLDEENDDKIQKKEDLETIRNEIESYIDDLEEEIEEDDTAQEAGEESGEGEIIEEDTKNDK